MRVNIPGGYLFQRKNSKRGNWVFYCYVDGEETQSSTGTSNLENAKAKASELYANFTKRVRMGTTVRNETFQEAAFAFITSEQQRLGIADLNAPGEKPRHLRQKARWAQDLCEFVGPRTLLEDVTSTRMRDLDDWLQDRRNAGGVWGNLKATVSPTTKNTFRALFRGIVDHAVRRGRIRPQDRPEMENVPPSPMRRSAFTISEVAQILEAAKHRWQASRDIAHARIAMAPPPDAWQADREALGRFRLWHALTVLAWSGMRPSSLVALRRRDVIYRKDAGVDALMQDPTEERGRFKVRSTTRKGTKRGAPREITTSIYPNRRADGSLEELRNLAKDDDSLIVPITTHSMNSAFRKILVEVKITSSEDGDPLSLYSLRHFYLTYLMQAKLPPQMIAKNSQTSLAMLEKHYDHLQNEWNADELANA